MSRKGRGGLSGFGAFVLLAAILFVASVAILRFIWLERAASVGGGPGPIAPAATGQHYLALALIALFSVAVLSHFRMVARPVWLGFALALLSGIYILVTDPAPTMADGLLVFLAYWVAGSVAVGLADGFVKGYSLRGL